MVKKINIIIILLIITKKKQKYINYYNNSKNNDFKFTKIKKAYIKYFFLDDKNINKFTLRNNLNFFNNKYLEKIYNIKIKEKNINCLHLLPIKIKNNLLLETQSISFKQFGVKYFNEVAFLFVVNIFVKSTKNICIFIKKSLDNVHFKKHRLYFFFFFNILITYIEPFFKELKVKGITLIFKGKLAKGGNSRKQTLFYKKGLYSLSNKNLKLEKNK
jgi:hypothetical protein